MCSRSVTQAGGITLKPDFCEREEQSWGGKKLNSRITFIPWYRNHCNSNFQWSSFVSTTLQRSCTKSFKVHQHWPLNSPWGRATETDKNQKSLIFSFLLQSWFKHKTTAWGYFCTRKRDEYSWILGHLAQSSSKCFSN